MGAILGVAGKAVKVGSVVGRKVAPAVTKGTKFVDKGIRVADQASVKAAQVVETGAQVVETGTQVVETGTQVVETGAQVVETGVDTVHGNGYISGGGMCNDIFMTIIAVIIMLVVLHFLDLDIPCEVQTLITVGIAVMAVYANRVWMFI